VTKEKVPKVKTWDEKWGNLTDDAILVSGNNAVHYSFKYINSNLQGGIRLSPSDVILDSPYVSGITAMCYQQLPVEYFASSVITIYSYLDYLNNSNPSHPHVSLFTTNHTARYEYGTTDLSGTNCRMRQVLIPIGDGYISATPVSPAGFNYLMKQLNDQIEPKERLTTYFITYGGANGRNVGWEACKKHTYALCMSAPTEDRNIQHAYSIFYKGVDLSLPKHIVRELFNLRLHPDMVGYTKKENDILSSFINVVLHKAVLARDILISQKDALYDAELFENVTAPHSYIFELHESVTNDLIQSGLINPTKRNKEWKGLLATKIVSMLVDEKITISGQTRSLNLDDDQIAELSDKMRKML
jgi:hypothetical protein